VNGDGVADTGTFEVNKPSNISPNFNNDVFIDWAADFPLFGNARGYIAAAGDS